MHWYAHTAPRNPTTMAALVSLFPQKEEKRKKRSREDTGETKRAYPWTWGENERCSLRVFRTYTLPPSPPRPPPPPALTLH